jgi:hypothetical protein
MSRCPATSRREKMRRKQNGEIMNGSGEMTASADKTEGAVHISVKSSGHDMKMTIEHQSRRLDGSCEATN